MQALRRHGWLVLYTLAAVCLASPAAGSQFSDMIQGLRDRQYYDYALFYLEQIAARPDLPEEVRQEIPYEKALILVESSKQTRSPEKQLELLDQAAAFLQDFVTGAPNHPRAGDANSQRAEILLGKARVEILQSKSPNNQGNRGEFQQRARGLVAQARQVFETAQKQHEETWNGFGRFVDETKEPEKYQAREQALMQLISAMLNVCQCRYEEAQTYDPGTPEFKKILNTAADEFEQLHQRYRNYTGGLYARLYQGKCYDDQGDFQKAMGIYNELLSHDGKSNRAIRKLQDKTLQFKMEALNRKDPPDSQVVVDLAREWLLDNKAISRSPTGIAIQWEQAVGLEALGDQREASKGDKEKNWRAARVQAQLINRFPSIYRDVSLAMMQRLNGKLGGKDRKPQDFETAQGIANQSFHAIRDLMEELKSAQDQKKPAEEIQKIEQELATELHDAQEMFELALNLANSGDDPKAVSMARLYLAYVHFWAKRNYEAAIIGQYVAKTAPKDESALAVDSAYLAMAAFAQAFNEAYGPVEARTSDLQFVINACEFLLSRWPNDSRANDARMMAGEMYKIGKQPAQAAAWFSKVPEGDPRYASAQLAAGQSSWDAYNAAARQPQDSRPPADQLKAYRTAAEQHLRTGIAKMSAVVPKEGIPPAELVGGKVALAQIMVTLGQHPEAISILVNDPQSVTKAVTVADESQRPKEGLQRRVVALDVNKLLLMAYIGDGKLDEARATMKTLETIAAGDPAGGDVTTLYVGLGKMLREELDRFKNAGESDRFEKAKTSYETFLNDLSQRKEGHSVGTLSWVAEAYSALGESAPDQTVAVAYFEKSSAALEEILRMASSDPNFADAEQLLAVRVRLAHALRMKKDYPAAEKLVTELLKERRDDLRLQLESALIYRDWAAQPGEEKKYLLAIGGNKDNQTLGFAPLAKRIYANVRRGSRPDLLETYLDTMYQSVSSRFQYAIAQQATKDKRQHLDNAELELVALARVTKGVTSEWRIKYNDLFHQIRETIADPKNRPVTDLEFGEDNPALPPQAPKPKPKEAPQLAEVKKPEPKPQPEPSSPIMTYIMLGGSTAIALVVIGLVIFRKKPKKPLIASHSTDSVSFDFDVPATPKSKAVVSVGPPREKRSSSGGAAAKASSAAASTAATRTPSAKPKPKPPAKS